MSKENDNDNIIIYFLYDFIYYGHYLHMISNIIVSFACKNDKSWIAIRNV